MCDSSHECAMDHTVQNLCVLIRTLAAATNRSPLTVSRLVTGSGDTVVRLERTKPDGRPLHRITTDRAYRAIRRLSEIWDDQRAPWPADIPRPDKPKKEVA